MSSACSLFCLNWQHVHCPIMSCLLKSGFIDYTACASLTKKFKKAISNDLECWGICGITYDTTYIDRRDAAVELGWAWVSLTLIMTMGLHVGRKDVCIMHPLSYPRFREPYSLLVRVFRTFTRISNYQFLVNFWLVATTYLPCYSNQQGKPLWTMMDFTSMSAGQE